ncbi:MAG: hypothetical protein V3W28_00345 [Thermoplasmata archaeon]
MSISINSEQLDFIDERRELGGTVSGTTRQVIQDLIEIEETLSSGGMIVQLPRFDIKSLQNLVDVGMLLSIEDGIRNAVKDYIVSSRQELAERAEYLRRVD